MLYRPGLLGRLPCPMGWYAGSGPPTISDDFSAGVAAGWTFSRGSANATNCLYTDTVSAPAFTTYAANAPRVLDFGLLMEPTRTNYFLNSEAPVTGNPSITLAVGRYVLWYHGTAASVGMSGVTATTVPFSGTATVGVPFAFQVTVAGTVAINIPTGVTRVQLENGTQPTSYIQTTAATATRADDRLNKNYLSGQLNAQQGTYWIEFFAQVPFNDALKSEASARLMTAGNGVYTNNNATDQLQVVSIGGTTNAVQYLLYNNTGSLYPGGTISMNMPPSGGVGRVSRVAVSISPDRTTIAADYVFGGPMNSPPRPSTLLAITLGGGGGGGNGTNGGTNGNHVPFNGFIRGFRYWPVAMPDAELKECTGPGYYSGPPVFNLDGTNANQWRRWLFTRSSAANGIHTDALMSDPAGTAWNQYGSGLIPPGLVRFTPKGLILEPARNNYFPTPDAVAASGTTGGLAAGQGYMLSVRGSGSITLTPNTVAGSGFPATATQGNPAVISVTTSGVASYTRTGTVELAQLEQCGTTNPAIGQDQGPTSFVRTTALAQGRTQEGTSIDPTGWWNQDQGTYYIEMMMIARVTGTYMWSVDDGTNNNREQLFATFGATGLLTWGSNTIYRGFNPGRIDPDVSQQPFPINTVVKIAVTVSSDRKRQLVMNGVLGGTGNLRQFGDDGLPPRPTITRMKLGMNTAGNISPSMFVRRWRYYDYMMTDAQLIALTAPGE